MEKRGKVYSISISPERGQLKKEVNAALFIEGSGIRDVGHSGDWGRQVTCLSYESVRRINIDKNLSMGPGDYAENVLTEGLDLYSLSPGDRIRLGKDVVLEITQIGKEDHPSIVSRTFGVSLLPIEGLFCRVISGGTVSKGDEASIVS